MDAKEREEQLRKIHEIADAIRAESKDEGIIMLYGMDSKFEIDVISTGSIMLDRALGVGGFPKGRLIELFGEEGGGKTSIALSVVAQAQRSGIICAYIDSENSLDPEWAELLGVDMELFMISQENGTEIVFDLVQTLIARGVGLIVVDSIAGTAPLAELEASMGELQIGLNARLIGQACRTIAQKANESGTMVILINQLREKIGVRFGSNETTPGGRAVKFYSSIRLDVRGRGFIKDKDEVVGIVIKAYVAKNKVAPPFTTASLDFFFKRGFDNELAIFDIAVAEGLIKRKGKSGYYVWEEISDTSKIRKNWAEFLRENPDKLKLLVDGVETRA